MTIIWSFSYNSFVKLNGKKNGQYNMKMLYPNLCYKEAVIHLQFWAYGSWDSLFPISVSPAANL